MSDSPDRLEIRPKIFIEKASPKLKIAFLGLIIITILIITLGRSRSKNEVIEQQPQEIKIENEKSFAPTTKNIGLLSSPPKEEPKIIKEAEEKIPEIKISRIPEPSEGTKRIIQMREQAYLAALNASITAYTGKKSSSGQEQNSQEIMPISISERPMPSAVALNAGQKNGYDVSADIDKEEFFERSRPDNKWINPNMRTAGQKYEIKTGSVIPAAMITSINSDLPGNMIAQVTQNVYDTATGNYLLIPQGTKLFGVYDSRVIMGQQRVLVAWNRIVFPDGSAMTIPSIPGADMAGNSGFHQKVDNHYFRIFGSSILMALITAGTAYAVDENNNTDNENSLSSQLNSALAQQFGQVTTSLLEKHLNIKPTLEIEPGYQFNIVLTKDLIFGGSYQGWR